MINILFDENIGFPMNILLFILVAIALFLSITLHEVSHGLVAYWNGDSTAKVQGRLTLNPTKHFDLIGCLMLLFVGFGYAKPVPVNPYNFKSYRKGCILVSIAGVSTNLILSFLTSGLYVLFYILFILSGEVTVIYYFASLFFYYFSWFNTVLCFFNLLPLYPLDGFNLIDALCKQQNRVVSFLKQYGQTILIAMMILSIFVDRMNAPDFFSPLDLYFKYTAQTVNYGFIRLWEIILGGLLA